MPTPAVPPHAADDARARPGTRRPSRRSGARPPAAFADVSADTVGSSVARVSGTGGGPLTAVVGHIDEIGVLVTHIDDDGFLRFGASAAGTRSSSSASG